MLKNKRDIIWIFLAFWLVINLFQAIFTGLFHDEAYYYFYSQHLAWGYYDHPPMVALLIRAGYLLFHHELGVRILFILLSCITLLILYKLTEAKDHLLFVVLAFSFMIFQVTGFLALPDSPLLFFTALFFFIYKKYTENYSITNGLLLGLVMAGLFYSKYLGILIVFFTVVSNPRLLVKKTFWISVLTTTLLFVPHLLWQYRHDFPSVYYHMLERSHDEVFRWNNFGDYIAGQIGQVNPILFFPIIYLLIKFKPGNSYERALKYSSAGILLLPFLMMAKGRVEANWTMAGLVPLFIISFIMMENRNKMHRFIYIAGGITLLLVIMIRVLLIYDYLPEKYSKVLRLDLYGWKAFSKKVEKIADGRPVVFIGSYQNPSTYNFYTGKKAFSFNNALYRSNQYDMEGIEKDLQGKEVLLIFNSRGVSMNDIKEYKVDLRDSIQYPNSKYRYYYFEKDYRSYNYIPVEFHLPDKTVKAGSHIEVPVSIMNPGTEPVNFGEKDSTKVYLTCYVLQYGKPVIINNFEDITSLVLKDEYHTSLKLKVPEIPGTYYMKVCIKSGWMPAGVNSRLEKLVVN